MNFSSVCLRLTLGLSLLLPLENASAVQVADPNKAPYAEAPETSVAFPWNNLGSYNGASTIFLGEIGAEGAFWAVTAAHNSQVGSVSFGGTLYSTVAGSFQQVYTTIGGNKAYADLLLYQVNITENPTGLTTLNIADSLPTTSDVLYLAGMGGGGAHWANASANIFFSPEGTRSAFRNGSRVFGSQTNALLPPAPSWGWAEDKDSGGGVFTLSGGEWLLAGVMIGINDGGGNPHQTYSVDLSYYYDEIGAIVGIPEPGTIAMVFIGGSGLLLALRRKQRTA